MKLAIVSLAILALQVSASRAAVFEILEASGGAISSNVGAFQYRCNPDDTYTNAVFVITAGDTSCGELEFTVLDMSPNSHLHIYDGSELERTHTCGNRIDGALIGESIMVQGGMATLVLNQPVCTSSDTTNLHISWQCTPNDPNAEPTEESGAFIMAEKGRVGWNNLISKKRQTTAIISDKDVCLRVDTDFAMGATADDCESSRLVVYNIEDDGCLNQLHQVCGHKTSLKAEGVKANLILVGTFDPALAMMESTSYSVRWDSNQCPNNCTAPYQNTTATPAPTTTTTTPTTTTTTTTPTTTTTTPTTTTTTTTPTTTTTTTTPTTTTTTTTPTTTTTTTTPTTTTTTTTPTTTTTTTTPTTTTSTTTTPTTTTTTTPTTTTTTTTEPPTTLNPCDPSYVDPVPVTPYEYIESTGCGGIIHLSCGYGGRILYKNNSFYDNNERCDWVVHSPSGYVEVKFVHEYFERYYDGILFGEFDTKKPIFTCSKLGATDYEEPQVIKTPAVLHFTSDNSVKRPGFQIDIKPVGKGCIDKHAVAMFHNADASGTYRFPKEGEQYPNSARPFGVIQAAPGQPTRSVSYRSMDLEDHYDCTQMYELGPYDELAPCREWERICKKCPAETLGSNVTSNSIVSYAWTDATNPATGYEVSWFPAVAQSVDAPAVVSGEFKTQEETFETFKDTP